MDKQKKIQEKAPSCDWKSLGRSIKDNKDRVIRYLGDFRWKGIRAERYKKEEGTKNWANIIRNVLIGNRGESTKFHLRYFEISPKGFSSLEWHNHEHVVICIRGKGNILLGNKWVKIGYLDTVYIAPKTIHQLKNPYNEPFGFFCIVNAKRDKPKITKKP
jgi:ribulose-bisphosphate carboxylase large chain